MPSTRYMCGSRIGPYISAKIFKSTCDVGQITTLKDEHLEKCVLAKDPMGFLRAGCTSLLLDAPNRKIVFSSLLGPALLDEEPNPFLAKEIRRLRQITYLLALTPVIIATILGCYPIVTGHFYRNALLSLFCTVRLPLNALLRLRPFFI